MEVLKNKDIEDGKRIADIFATLSEENKIWQSFICQPLEIRKLPIPVKRR